MSSMNSMVPLDGHERPKSKRPLLIVVIVCLAIGIGVGVAIGYFSRYVPTAKPDEGPSFGPGVPDKITQEATEGITEQIIEGIKAENIDEYLEEWTRTPHLAGTPADLETANKLRGIWKQQGLDPVQVVGYDVLLSYPDKTNNNTVTLFDSNDGVIHRTAVDEAKLGRPEQENPDIVSPLHGYSATGRVEGPLVYVNFGRIEDFQYLRDNKSMDLTGTIAIARYGAIFRGSKVLNAQNFGCVGTIIYSDPEQYAPEGTDPAQVYPNAEWLPPTGVQRGSVLGLSTHAGDPLTPGYPSIDTAHRIREEDAVTLPKIPSQPISYGDAKHFLSAMAGEEVPESWRGSLNLTYRFGPGLTNTSLKVVLNVGTRNERRKTYNVIGYLKGEVEPDRYVLLGNHRDAWVFGAVDPTSGTVTQIEVTRVLGKIYQNGWRPRRTLVFCSWGAEEHGLIGSNEWVEHYQKVLGERSVVMLNVDTASLGCTTLFGKGVPIVHDAMYEVAKKIPNPVQSETDAGRPTVYDTWANVLPGKDLDGNTVDTPQINQLGSGSDHAPFILRLGIPALDVRYAKANPLYHSAYSTYHYMKNYIDPDFKCHQAVGQYWAEMGRYMADSLILPFNVSRYSEELKRYTMDLKKEYGGQMQNHNISLDKLDETVEDFVKEANAFQSRLSSVNKNNPMETRKINDQMIQLERAFTDQAGIPGRPLQKHLLFAPNQHNVYAGSTYPGMEDAMFEIERDPDQRGRWENVKQHLSVIIFVIRSAASTLRPVTEFGGTS